MTKSPAPHNIIIMIGQLAHGGSERQLFYFLRHCDRNRWTPIVCVSGELGYWEAPLRALGVQVILLNGSRLRKLATLRQICRSTGARCFFSWSSYTNAFAGALFGIGMQRIGSFRNADYADLPRRLRPLWKFLCLRSIRVAVCNSRETYNTIAALSHADVIFVPNAVDVYSPEQVRTHRTHWRQALGVREDQILIVGVGRIAPQKNFGRFIDAIGLARGVDSIRAVIAGRDFGERRDLEIRARMAGIDDIISFVGEVADARELICAADIFLLTSDFEGTPKVVLEAMSIGVACVTTPVHGVDDLSEGGASLRVVDPDPKILAGEILRLVGDAELRAQLGANARRLIRENFDPRSSADKLWALCEVPEPMEA